MVQVKLMQSNAATTTNMVTENGFVSTYGVDTTDISK